MIAKTCARCGRVLKATTPRIYSRWTHHYYCAAVKQCAKRAARKKVAA